MPHFGLIDDNLPEEEQLLIRARLHIRGGKIRFNRGNISDGIAALYDALVSALQWYAIKNDYDIGLGDEKQIFDLLIKSNVLDRKFNFGKFENLLEKSFESELESLKNDSILEEFYSLMVQIGVMPFNDEDLPEGEPITL